MVKCRSGEGTQFQKPRYSLDGGVGKRTSQVENEDGMETQ